jgi:hypothetical protein
VSPTGIAVVDKCYTDVLLPDGGVLILYLVRLRLFGLPLAWISAELTGAHGGRRTGSAAALRVHGEDGRRRFGPGGRVRWRTPGLSGELELSPRHPPAALCDPVFEADGQLVRWTVEVPDADARATLRWPGGGCEAAGRGYRDRVLARAVPWRFPVTALSWGHAAVGDRAAVWFAADTPAGARSARWHDGQLDADGPLPSLRADRLLLDERLGERLAGPVARAAPLLRRLTSDPHQRRWTGAAGLRGLSGRALWEEVVWG